MIRIENIKIYDDLSDKEVLKVALKQNFLDPGLVRDFVIFKKSIDARNKDNIYYNYTIDIDYAGKCNPKLKRVDRESFKLNLNKNRKSNAKPVIIGAGPAGLFCALILAQNGYKPIVIERGKCVLDRKNDLEEFLKTRKFNPDSNTQFGEGGAGTFSDGKLTTNVNHKYGRIVLKEFVNHGAPEEILYVNKPHIGTDNLVKIVQNIREDIISLGGEFHFEEKVIDFYEENSKLTKVISIDKTGNKKEYETDTAVFAIGHSARDTFEVLYKKGLKMEKKNFSIGVRIEHLQKMINESQYGKNPKLNLPPAEYKLVYHDPNGRACYTFCMCPGGVVIASGSAEDEIVTNGMSNFNRDGVNANSAVLVSVTPSDFEGESPLTGLYFQKELEKKAFELGGSNFNAPVQRYEDFCLNKKSEKVGDIIPSYEPGYTLSNLNEILPDYISEILKKGIDDFGRKIKGFDSPDAILTGVETRSSSPVRIVRNEELVANVEGLYPCGEGAGYAGGITTAAMDGIKVAVKIIEG